MSKKELDKRPAERTSKALLTNTFLSGKIRADAKFYHDPKPREGLIITFEQKIAGYRRKK